MPQTLNRQKIRECHSDMSRKSKIRNAAEKAGELHNFNKLPPLFFIVPASRRHHLNGWGGLADHSYNVYETLKKWGLPWNLAFQIGIYHDLGKLYDYVEDKTENGNICYKLSKKSPFEELHGSQCVRKIKELKINLPEEIMEAIQYHQELWDETKSYIVDRKLVSMVYNKNILAVYAHLADMYSSHIIERCL